MNLIVCDNGSEDPTRDVLSGIPESAFIPWCRKLGFQEVRVLDRVIPRERRYDGTPMTPSEIRYKNIEHIEKKLTMEVRTKYILYVDSDVEAPVDCVKLMLDTMENDPKLAFTGVLYDWVADHVKLGCSLARTEIMRDIDFSSVNGCPCRSLTKELQKRGWKVAHVPPESVLRPGYGIVRMIGEHDRFSWR
jgi:hypothetical protein